MLRLPWRSLWNCCNKTVGYVTHLSLSVVLPYNGKFPGLSLWVRCSYCLAKKKTSKTHTNDHNSNAWNCRTAHWIIHSKSGDALTKLTFAQTQATSPFSFSIFPPTKIRELRRRIFIRHLLSISFSQFPSIRWIFSVQSEHTTHQCLSIIKIAIFVLAVAKPSHSNGFSSILSEFSRLFAVIFHFDFHLVYCLQCTHHIIMY